MLTENSANDFFSSKNDNSCTRGARASDFVSYKFILFCTYISRKGKSRYRLLGKANIYLWYRKEINFIWKTAIAMQHQSSGDRCCRGGKMHSENVILGSDMSNTWSDQLIRTPLETEQIPQSLRAFVPFSLPESPWSLWPKIPVNICKACYEWTLQ